MSTSIKPSLIGGSIDLTQDGIHTLDFTSHSLIMLPSTSLLGERMKKENTNSLCQTDQYTSIRSSPDPAN